MAKIVYQYDDTGTYLYPTQADESPLEPGVFLFPKNTTEIAPPALDKEQIAKWNGQEWTVENVNKPHPVDLLVDFFVLNPDTWNYIQRCVENKSTKLK